jgi:predicted ATP-grasp superfamily ATP-dependent carboligase
MTRVFVYEHLCTLTGVTSSLRAEGRAMLSAALADLAACEGVRPVSMVEPSLVETMRSISSGVEVHEGMGEGVFRRLARTCEFALVIAPEFDDILARRCEWALESGCRLLGPSPEAVRLCADKLRLAEVLREVGIPVPHTIPYQAESPPTDGYPYVIKPRTGAGTMATFLVHSAADFRSAGAAAVAQGYEGEPIAQPYMRGTPGSVAVILLSSNSALTLLPTRQLIETTRPTGQMRYAGGIITYPIKLGYEIIRARGATYSIPGMAGYVGVDLIDSGWESVVIEINPRLTTSYVGLRRLSKVNLMQVLLDVVRGKEPPPLSWREGRVRFDPDGTVYEEAMGQRQD